MKTKLLVYGVALVLGCILKLLFEQPAMAEPAQSESNRVEVVRLPIIEVRKAASRPENQPRIEIVVTPAFNVDRDNAAELKKLVYAQYDQMQKNKWDKIIRQIESDYGLSIKKISQSYPLEESVIYGLVVIESKGDRWARSRSVGAKGLTQIYSIPAAYWQEVKVRLGVEKVDVWDPWHNLNLGATTLTNYTRDKKGDLLLGMAAYVWGGDKHAFTKGDHFMAIKAHMPKVPRTYPIQIQAAALMKKVMDKHATALPYDRDCDREYRKCHRHQGQDNCLKTKDVCEFEEKETRQLIEAIPLQGIDY